MIKRRTFLLISAVAVTLLSGCATSSMYQWGSYDQLLYQSYKSPEKSDALRLALEAHVSTVEASKQKVAPGLYAEIGTLYFQKGDTARATAFYSKERDAWPESSGLMNVLMKNINKPKTDSTEVKP